MPLAPVRRIPPHGVQRHCAAPAYFKRDAADGWGFGRCGCSMLPLCTLTA